MSEKPLNCQCALGGVYARLVCKLVTHGPDVSCDLRGVQDPLILSMRVGGVYAVWGDHYREYKNLHLNIKVKKYIIYKYTSIKIYEHISIHVYKYIRIQVYKYISISVFSIIIVITSNNNKHEQRNTNNNNNNDDDDDDDGDDDDDDDDSFIQNIETEV